MWAAARFDFKLSASEWKLLTLRQFGALRERQTEERKVAYMCAGVISATIANAIGGAKSEPWDFFPVLKECEPKPTAMSIQSMAVVLGAKKAKK